MKNKFCIFILSHQNYDQCKTLDMLKKYNYNGDWKIVVDDLDNQLNLYKEKYKDNLIIFKKEDWFDSVDTAYSPGWDSSSSPVYARIFLEEYAEKNNIKNYAVMDDDIQRLNLVRPLPNKLEKKQIEDINKVLDLLIDYQNSTNIYCLGFSNPLTFIGGNYNANKILNKRKIANIFLLHKDRKLKWKTIFYDDCNTCLTNGVVGKLILQLPFIEIIADIQGSQNQNKGKKIADGGMQELYEKSNQYTRAFYSVMVQPSSVFLNGFKNKDNLYPNIKNVNQFPRIISKKEKYG